MPAKKRAKAVQQSLFDAAPAPPGRAWRSESNRVAWEASLERQARYMAGDASAWEAWMGPSPLEQYRLAREAAGKPMLGPPVRRLRNGDILTCGDWLSLALDEERAALASVLAARATALTSGHTVLPSDG